jgi:hypothetical protein
MKQDSPLQIWLIDAKRIGADNSEFFPIQSLLELIQEETVEQELCWLQPAGAPSGTQRDAKRTAKQICSTEKSYRKIFAILVCIEALEKIYSFLDEGVHDGFLPLEKRKQGDRPAQFDFVRNSKPLSCFENFGRIKTSHFDFYQWKVHAPIFRKPFQGKVQRLDLEHDAILPFVSEREVTGGGYGRIWKVEIHREHHDFDGSEVRTAFLRSSSVG